MVSLLGQPCRLHACILALSVIDQFRDSFVNVSAILRIRECISNMVTPILRGVLEKREL